MKQLIFFLLLFLFVPPPSWALFEKKPKPEKFFDLDKNGWMNLYERSLLATYNRFHWEMADSKKKKKFDYNNDSLLGPQEWEMYKKSKKDKKIKMAPGMRF